MNSSDHHSRNQQISKIIDKLYLCLLVPGALSKSPSFVADFNLHKE